jgi:hypothetical protein
MQNNKDNLLSIINIKEDCSKIIDVFKKCNINLKFVDTHHIIKETDTTINGCSLIFSGSKRNAILNSLKKSKINIDTAELTVIGKYHGALKYYYKLDPLFYK